MLAGGCVSKPALARKKLKSWWWMPNGVGMLIVAEDEHGRRWVRVLPAAAVVVVLAGVSFLAGQGAGGGSHTQTAANTGRVVPPITTTVTQTIQARPSTRLVVRHDTHTITRTTTQTVRTAAPSAAAANLSSGGLLSTATVRKAEFGSVAVANLCVADSAGNYKQESADINSAVSGLVTFDSALKTDPDTQYRDYTARSPSATTSMRQIAATLTSATFLDEGGACTHEAQDIVTTLQGLAPGQ
jgi:hypothetical protein